MWKTTTAGKTTVSKIEDRYEDTKLILGIWALVHYLVVDNLEGRIIVFSNILTGSSLLGLPLYPTPRADLDIQIAVC